MSASSSTDSGAAIGDEAGARFARSRALAVLRVRSRALAVALLPAAAAVVLLAGGATGRLSGAGWDAARWAVSSCAVVVLLLAGGVAAVVARAKPALSPTVAVSEKAAPDLYRLVRDLADRLGVPAPSAIALTPDCDSWLEDRTHPAHASAEAGQVTPGAAVPPGAAGGARGRPGRAGPRSARRMAPVAPVLVIGSPFLWWMRIAELRAVLAPVVAGTGPAAHPDIAAARRFVRGLDAAVAVAVGPGLGFIRGAALGFVGWVTRLLLRGCGEHVALMERGVATAASERAQTVDYGLRIVAQEQVGLAYAGWDRLLTRVALPAWRMGRWPSRLDAGVVSALTELARRDRLAEGFTSRLGERPACDLLEEPGAIDEAASLLAARLFHGGPAEVGPEWAPVHWQQYPEEVVDRKWRTEAARLHRVLDDMGVRHPAGPSGPMGPTLDRVMDHLSHRPGNGTDRSSGRESGQGPDVAGDGQAAGRGADGSSERLGGQAGGGQAGQAGGVAERDGGQVISAAGASSDTPADVLAACISAELSREGDASQGAAPQVGAEAGGWSATRATEPLPLVPLQPPRTGRDLLADHVTAMVCCSAVDTAGAAPGLDWLDGPTLLVGGERRADLSAPVLCLVEDGDAQPLRSWLATLGVRPEKPVRLV